MMRRYVASTASLATMFWILMGFLILRADARPLTEPPHRNGSKLLNDMQGHVLVDRSHSILVTPASRSISAYSFPRTWPRLVEKYPNKYPDNIPAKSLEGQLRAVRYCYVSNQAAEELQPLLLKAVAMWMPAVIRSSLRFMPDASCQPQLDVPCICTSETEPDALQITNVDMTAQTAEIAEVQHTEDPKPATGSYEPLPKSRSSQTDSRMQSRAATGSMQGDGERVTSPSDPSAGQSQAQQKGDSQQPDNVNENEQANIGGGTAASQVGLPAPGAGGEEPAGTDEEEWGELPLDVSKFHPGFGPNGEVPKGRDLLPPTPPGWKPSYADGGAFRAAATVGYARQNSMIFQLAGNDPEHQRPDAIAGKWINFNCNYLAGAEAARIAVTKSDDAVFEGLSAEERWTKVCSVRELGMAYFPRLKDFVPYSSNTEFGPSWHTIAYDYLSIMQYSSAAAAPIKDDPEPGERPDSSEFETWPLLRHPSRVVRDSLRTIEDAGSWYDEKKAISVLDIFRVAQMYPMKKRGVLQEILAMQEKGWQKTPVQFGAYQTVVSPAETPTLPPQQREPISSAGSPEMSANEPAAQNQGSASGEQGGKGKEPEALDIARSKY